MAEWREGKCSVRPGHNPRSKVTYEVTTVQGPEGKRISVCRAHWRRLCRGDQLVLEGGEA